MISSRTCPVDLFCLCTQIPGARVADGSDLQVALSGPCGGDSAYSPPTNDCPKVIKVNLKWNHTVERDERKKHNYQEIQKEIQKWIWALDVAATRFE